MIRSSYAGIPPAPSVLFGRNAEVELLVDALAGRTAAPLAVVGGPGIGKSSLALAVIHHPSVVSVFGSRRFFVSCDAAADSDTLIASLGATLRCLHSTVSRTETKVIRALSSESVFLVLDNFESPWEPVKSRAGVERFLLVLANIPTLRFMVTMRGSERPAGIAWRRPFLPPLAPLAPDAAWHAFVAISRVDEDDPDLPLVLNAVDSLPLALTLMATMAQFEPCGTLLAKWNAQASATLQRRGMALSTIDLSVKLSITSPRMVECPEAITLLSLLSLLSEGIDEGEVPFMAPKLVNHGACISALLQTALVHRTRDGTIRVLGPISSFMIRYYPVAPAQLYAFFNHFLIMTVRLRAAACLPDDPPVAPHRIPARDLVDLKLQRAALTNSNPDFRATVRSQALLRELAAQAGQDIPDMALFLLGSVTAGGDIEHVARCIYVTGMATMHVATHKAADAEVLFTKAMNLFIEKGTVGGQISCLLGLVRATGDVVHAEAALALAETLRDVRWRLICLQSLATASERHGNVARATECHARVLQTVRGSGAPHLDFLAATIPEIARAHMSRGRFAQALQSYAEALAIAGAADDQRALATCALDLGELCLLRSDCAGALRHLRDAYRQFRALGGTRLAVASLVRCAWTYIAMDDAPGATQALANALLMAQAQGNSWPWGVGLCMRGLGDLALYEGDMAAADANYAAAMRNFVARPFSAADALRKLGELASARADPDTARRCYILSAVMNRKLEEIVTLIFALNGLGDVLLGCGDADTSRALSQAVLPRLVLMGTKREISQCLLRLARISRLAGHVAVAAKQCSEALKYCTSGGDLRTTGLCNAFLHQLHM